MVISGEPAGTGRCFLGFHVRDARKQWLESYDPNTYLEQDVESVTLPDFVFKELIIFSSNDCELSIQSV